MPALKPSDPQFDNSPEIQRRWNAGEVVPDGEYWCHQQIRVIGKSIVGNVTLRFTVNDAYWLLAWLNTVGKRIEGITVVGTNANGTGYGPNAQLAKPFPPNGICVRDCYDGVIEGVTVKQVWSQGINACNVDGFTVRNSTCDGTGKDGISVIVHKEATAFARNILIERNSLTRNGDDQISIWGGPWQAELGTPEYHVQGVTIRENVLSNFRSKKDPKALGVGIRLGCGIDGVMVLDNVISHTVKSGIEVSNWGRKDKAPVFSMNGVITGNKISGVGTMDPPETPFPNQKKDAIYTPGVQNFLCRGTS
jgi:hypothetical protein